MKILFLHGWQSIPGGAKPSYLAQQGHTVINPKLPDEDFQDAVRIAQAEFDEHRPDVIVGSSRGGAVAMNLNSGFTPLLLLCPAWKRWGTARTVKPGTVILHSEADEVIPIAESRELVQASGLHESALVVLGTDHRLADPESLAAMLDACVSGGQSPKGADQTIDEVLVGCDFGVPSKAGDQAKKVILIEAVRTGPQRYEIRPTGRNERLVRDFSKNGHWSLNRRGWTVPSLATSLAADLDVRVGSFDFPFSIPLALLQDPLFAKALKQNTFASRANWATFVSANLKLEFDSDQASGSLQGLTFFKPWRDKRYWLKRATDRATGGSPPMKHKFQNLFAMTIAGASFLRTIVRGGFHEILDSDRMPTNGRIAFETYPGKIAAHIGFKGSYKKLPAECLLRAEEFLKERGVQLHFDEAVKKFCLEYRTSGDDPDGADAFLCLLTSISFREGFAELCSGMANRQILQDEGCIIVPRR